ncbi:MAG: DNA-processing protein DprA [Polyangiaceae bacterium]
MASELLQPDDAAYPERLAEIGAPPLYLQGAVPRAPGVAIVGRRDASAGAVRFARRLARGLAESGFVVWSGGAVGIDAAAHTGALEAGAPTVVVCGAGLDVDYPPEHVDLFRDVVRGGGARLARVPDGTLPFPSNFLKRNEVLAAATLATVVVEAGVRSGARNTAAHARRLGRPLCIVPGTPWDVRGAGCALELVLGGTAVACLQDVIAILDGLPPPPTAVKARRPPQQGLLAGLEQDASGASVAATPVRSRAGSRRASGPGRSTCPLAAAAGEIVPPLVGELDGLPAEHLAVLAALGDRPLHIDQVAEKTGLSSRAASASLLTLTLHAVVVEGPVGFYRGVPAQPRRRAR